MQESSVNTLDIPIAGDDPATLAAAVGCSFRVAVANIGPVPVLVSYDSGALAVDRPVAKTYALQPGKDQVFVLAKDQKLFAAAQGAGGRVSIAVSAAIGGGFEA